jgi:hypothetical protein
MASKQDQCDIVTVTFVPQCPIYMMGLMALTRWQDLKSGQWLLPRKWDLSPKTRLEEEAGKSAWPWRLRMEGRWPARSRGLSF